LLTKLRAGFTFNNERRTCQEFVRAKLGAMAAKPSMRIKRDALPAGVQRRAFEIGFLSRMHQRLCSPLGGVTRRAKPVCGSEQTDAVRHR
jgi:hypothetical protein